MKFNCRVFSLIFIFLLLLAFSAASYPGFTDLQNSLPTMALYIGLALLASIGIVSIAWMVASFFNHDGIKAYAKAELFEIIYSAILLILIFALFPVFDTAIQLSSNYFYSQTTINQVKALALTDNAYSSIPIHFQYAKFFLGSLFNEGVIFNANLYSGYSITGVLEEIYLSVDLFWEQRGLINYNPLKGFFHMGNSMKMQIFDLVIKVLIITKFQEIFLHVFLYGVFPAFLGVGLVLRSFQFTRKLGGLMMALALGFYFVFPLAYLLGGMIYAGSDGLYKDIITSIDSRLSPDYDGYKTDVDMAEKIKQQIENGELNIHSPTQTEEELKNSLAGVDVCNIFKNPGTNSGTQDSFKDWVDTLKDNGIGITAIDDSYLKISSRLIFFSMFFSFFGLMATIASIRSLSMLFGGDMEIAGLTHLI
ncbi:MAG: hypothetical protein WC501_01575 [Candidatus Micrarchaeia archaeon]